MLKKFRENIWTSSADLKLFGVGLGTRMTVIKMADETLWVHSPIQLSPELKAEIDSLGTVKHVVAPNKWHHLFVNDFRLAYPTAAFYGAPGLDKKRPDLHFDRMITKDQDCPWNPVLQHKIIEGVPIFNEVVFYHQASKTLIVTDLALHICESHSRFTRTILKLMGSYGKFGWAKIEKLIYVRDASAFKRSLENILEWDIEAILLTHGDPVESDGHRRLQAAFF